MTAPDGARDALEGPCAEDRCDWFPWDELHACPACTKAFCDSHLHPGDHGCEEVVP